MPVVEIELEDLRNLIGDKLPAKIEELEPYIYDIKGEVEACDEKIMAVKIGDTNRPELWGVEGIARELKGLLGVERGCREYSAASTDLKVFVNTKLQKVRPYIACAVVKGMELNDAIIKQLMQLQDKIDTTYGRNRKKTSIGLYNFDLLKFPLKYVMTKPHENAFVPLGFTEQLAPHEILKRHPKGIEYGNILKDLEEYPILLDADSKVLSMPPIINSEELGKINDATKNILVEVTGIDYEAVNNVLTVITTALVERGGKIFSVTIDYAYRKPDATPHLETKTLKISTEQVTKLLGIKTLPDEIVKLLQKMRYSASADKDIISVRIPCYRQDIMHSVDVVEDIAIAYGYNNFDLAPIAIPTAGKLSETEKLSNKIREICIGLGSQETLNFTLTNKNNLFAKMAAKEENIVDLENPVSFTYSCLRNKLLPSLLEFLSHNTTKEFPQKVFEVGDVVYPDSKKDEMSTTERRLAFAISHPTANFTEAKQALETVFRNLGKPVELKEAEHDSFIGGRCAKVFVGKDDVGIIGEVHPQVLSNWGLEMPVVGFEIKI